MNYRIIGVRSSAAVLLVGLLAVPGISAALTLEEALRLAEREAPSLAARNANLLAAQSAIGPAGELPDPKVTLGLQSVPIEGEASLRLNAEPMTMQMVGLMQEVPNRAKRHARVQAAEATAALAHAQQRVERIKIRQLTAQAWIDAMAAEQKLKIFKQLYAENQLTSQAVQARIAGGRGLTADSLLPRQEAAQLAEQQDLLKRDQAIARAGLRRWIGEAASTPLDGNWPTWGNDIDLYRHNLNRHPELMAFGPMGDRAEARIAEAVSDKKPDWGWGAEYQRRGGGFGDMVSVSVSFDLPVFPGSRQEPRIAAERARLAGLQAEQQAMLRLYEQQLAEDAADLQRLKQAVSRLDETLLPLAEEKIRLAMTDYRSGKGELTSVIDAREALVTLRMRRVDLSRDQSLVSARLYFAFGDIQP
ncbi:TolC family protein [Pseudomonas profundi]|uniref:TolC family protein n=1 Tax=Pseudomonas profundi TaxID=1981513 RepID=UPI00123B880A|nr:TolC family protein [Pseudomonas profundi]